MDRAFFRVCKSKGALTRHHHHHHPALSLSLLISLSNRDVCALGRADIETLSLSLLQRNGRTRTKKKAPPPWRSTTQTSRKARKVRTLFFDRRSNKRARRSIGFDLFSLFVLSFSRHISLTTQCAMLSTDLLTGSLTYENKFSLDAKPIEGGVRVVFVFVIAFESDSFSHPTPTNFACSTRKKEIENHSKRRRSPRMKRERERN